MKIKKLGKALLEILRWVQLFKHGLGWKCTPASAGFHHPAAQCSYGEGRREIPHDSSGPCSSTILLGWQCGVTVSSTGSSTSFEPQLSPLKCWGASILATVSVAYSSCHRWCLWEDCEIKKSPWRRGTQLRRDVAETNDTAGTNGMQKRLILCVHCSKWW